MGRLLNDDVIKIIQDLKSKNYQRPDIQKYLVKNQIVPKIGLSTISLALTKKNSKSFYKVPT